MNLIRGSAPSLRLSVPSTNTTHYDHTVTVKSVCHVSFFHGYFSFVSLVFLGDLGFRHFNYVLLWIPAHPEEHCTTCESRSENPKYVSLYVCVFLCV